MWVADFFASGWSGGDNDLTCLEEPWTAAGIWDGEGSRGPDREELGAENAPPPGPGRGPAWLPVVWPQSRGQTSSVAGTRSAASSQPR